MISASLLSKLGQVPVLKKCLRAAARRYRDGSIVTINRGFAEGLRWQRCHRYVNGYWLGIYELPLQRAISEFLGEGDVFYDVGANAGFFTILGARRVGPSGTVYAFEPHPFNAMTVRTQVEINGFRNCEVISAAVGAKEGVCGLIDKGELSTCHVGSVFEASEMLHCQSVALTSLDSFAFEHRPPDMIKIDVEGAESDVLKGAQRLLSRRPPPRIACEVHGANWVTVYRTLLDAGYLLFDVSGSSVQIDNPTRFLIATANKGSQFLESSDVNRI